MTKSSDDMLSTKALRVICAVADCRDASAAAQQINMSLPTLSRILKAAEAELGVTVYQRGWAGKEPTAAGEVVVNQCRRILNDLEKVDRTIGGKKTLRGPLALHLRWYQLEAVAAIVRTGSASAAATQLGVRQPAISQAVRQIAGALKTQLFTLRKSGLSPAPAALALAALWERVQADLEALPSLIERAAKGLSGRITIGMLPFSGQDLVMRAFADLSRRHPSLRLSAVPGSYNLLAEALRRHEIDLMIGILRDPPPSKEFKEEQLYEEQFVLVARRGHPCHKSSVTIEALADLNWIVAPHGTPIRNYFDVMFRDVGRKPPAQTCEILSFSDAEQMIIHSDAIALLSYSRIHLRKLRRELRRVKYPLRGNRLPIGLTSLGSYRANGPLAEFVDSLKDIVAVEGL